ncbi:MAG TPA: trypsin-like peptidase domain-containing protein [Acidimicrobiia bacterium]|nr:trypsin-like peptidase domain-containing protein [Acidimicrobiia bacterium]
MINEETTQDPATPESVEGVEQADPGNVSVLTDSPETVELPSVPEPPGDYSAAPPSPPAAAPRNRLSPWLIGLLALLLVAGSSAVTYLVTTGVGQESTGAQDEAAAAPEPLSPGEEPIAAAAAVILPSVVQIQTGSGLGSGVGSGVIYDSDGLILTAAHVVGDNDSVTVRFADGEQVEGTVLGGTSGADVAVVQVDRTGLPAAELALDQDPQVGQLAIAVGSPWGLQGTVTAGIVSAVDQAIPSGSSARAVLQTDAAINPGNSGGPLVDREGRVLGINVSIFSLSGANDGVGFAVPIDVAHDIAERVVAGESIQGAFLGVNLGRVDSGPAGAVITSVNPGSAAEQAGLEVDDLVIEIDGSPVQRPADLAAQVQTHQPGDTVEIVVVRDDEELAFSVTLGERPDDIG